MALFGHKGPDDLSRLEQWFSVSSYSHTGNFKNPHAQIHIPNQSNQSLRGWDPGSTTFSSFLGDCNVQPEKRIAGLVGVTERDGISLLSNQDTDADKSRKVPFLIKWQSILVEGSLKTVIDSSGS